MQKSTEVNATVRSPSRGMKFRKGRGFSLSEIKQAGKSVQELKNMKISIDFLRKSVHKENIEILKNLKVSQTNTKKREPFTPKERRRTEFKPKGKKRTIKKDKTSVLEKPAAVVKPAPIKEKPKEAVVESKATPKGRLPLTELSGLGPATEQKFVELGVNSVEELLLEDPGELGQLIKGCSEDRIKKWIEEGKELINK
ncbi:MAG: ribosomal protein L13e [Candidatus Lokiarchaeota archaeon]